jgi:hypothetical protein
MAQQKAATPINTRLLCLLEKLLSQGPNKSSMLAGNEIPNENLIVFHNNLAIGQ